MKITFRPAASRRQPSPSPARARLTFVLVALLASALASEARAAKPEDEAITLYKKGVDLGNEGKLDEAIGAFQQAIQKAPKRFDAAYLKLGLAYEMSSRWPEAMAAYQIAIEIDKKKKPDGHRFLGNLYRKMGLFPLAVDAHKEALTRAEAVHKKTPEKVADFHYDLSLDYVEMKLYGDAIRTLEKAVSMDPAKKGYKLMLANAFALSDKLDEADAQYRKVLDAEPKSGDAMYGLGFVARKRGDKEASKDWLKKACAEGNPKACREARDRYKTLE
jgi:tetratricopeptide (TPR) repeat protein